MATHSSILGWKIPWTEAPGALQSLGCKESDRTEWLSTRSPGRGAKLMAQPQKQEGSPEEAHTPTGVLPLMKEARTYNGKKTVFSLTGAEKPHSYM